MNSAPIASRSSRRWTRPSSALMASVIAVDLRVWIFVTGKWRRGDLCSHGEHGGRRAHEESLQIGSTPRQVAGELRGGNSPQVAPIGVDGPDVPVLVALHPVWRAGTDLAGPEPLEERSAPPDGAVRGDIECLDVA